MAARKLGETQERLFGEEKGKRNQNTESYCRYSFVQKIKKILQRIHTKNLK